MDLPHLHLYTYVNGRPTAFVDPLGLAPCKSGKCADCESGSWSVNTVTSRVFVVGAFKWTNVNEYQCIGSGLKCSSQSECEALGGGWSVGVSTSGGFAGWGKCKCIEGLGKRDTIAFGAANVSVSISNSDCWGLSGGVGMPGLKKLLGFGSAYLAGVKCKTVARSCRGN